MTNPHVSVCIANYNGVGMIEDCIKSVLSQVCEFDVEILVHDDASPDGSAELVRQQFSQVILIESTENVGFCVANNRMAGAARGKYLLLLNNDAMLLPGALAALEFEAERLGRHAILSLPQYDFETGQLVDCGCFLDLFCNPVPNLNLVRSEVAMVIGACLWIPKNLWDELGGFPEWFGSIGEDLYLCCLARIKGYSVIALGSSGYRHRSGASFGGGKIHEQRLVSTIRRRALSERNKTFVMVLCFPFLVLLILLPLHLLLLHFEGLAVSVLKKNASLWRRVYAPLMPALWQHRRALMILRKEIHARKIGKAKNFFSPFHCVPWKLKMLLKYGLPDIKP